MMVRLSARLDSHFTTPWLSGKNPVTKSVGVGLQVVLDLLAFRL